MSLVLFIAGIDAALDETGLELINGVGIASCLLSISELASESTSAELWL
jgi:hypothetical protein